MCLLLPRIHALVLNCCRSGCCCCSCCYRCYCCCYCCSSLFSCNFIPSELSFFCLSLHLDTVNHRTVQLVLLHQAKQSSYALSLSSKVKASLVLLCILRSTTSSIRLFLSKANQHVYTSSLLLHFTSASPSNDATY